MSEDEKLLKEAKKLPWEDRLSHKNWKVRNDGCIDLAAACDGIVDPKDPRLREIGHLFKKAVADSNAAVQEKALDALIAFLRAADADASRYAKEVCDSIAAKCLTGRPKTIEKAQAAFLLWVELEASEAFLDTMEKAIKNKVAKAVVPAIDVMYQSLSDFGTKVVPPKRVLRMLPELFDHQDQNVRASAKGLTIELCRWIGKDAVKSILFEKMRDTMRKEIEAEMDNVTGVSRPTRKIRSEQSKEIEQEASAEVSAPGQAEEAVASVSQDIDEYDLVDPVDILTPLGKSSFWEGVKATKWSERRDAVAELSKLASAKRFATGDYTEVCRTLKKLITDVNIAVAIEAIQSTGYLASGLRKDFTVCSRILLPVLLEKLKEKKQTVVDALMQALQSMHKSGCVSLADVIEEIKLATKNKVPSVRFLTLNWVTFCIETGGKAAATKLHKDYIPVLMECLNDGTPEVRDASFAALAAFAKHVGMRPLERSLEKLDDVRKKKLTEMIGGGGPASTPATASVVSRASASDEELVVKKSAASLLSGKKPVVQPQTAKKSAASKPAAGKKGDAGKAVDTSKDDVEVGEMSLEEIESRVGTLVQPEIIANLKSAVWKERLEAMTSLKESLESMPPVKESEIIVRLLSVLPGWGEKNVQVQQKVIEVITHLAETAVTFSKRSVMLCLSGLAERCADIKTRAQATRCLTCFCEAVGPNFIFEKMYKIAREHKNPKVLSEGLSWITTAIDDFGVGHIKMKDLLEFCKDVGLQSSAPATRNATIKLIGVLHKSVGPALKNFLTDVKPALQSALDAEYEKNPYEGAVSAPKRSVRGVDDTVAAGGGDGLPREDISGKLASPIIKNLGSTEWKVRQESIEAVNKIIDEANKRILPTGTGELFGALKGRLSDSNKNLVMMTLSTLGSIATAMGPAVEKTSKGVLSDVLKCLGDNKKLMREAVVKALDGWVEAVPLDKMLQYIVPSLVDPKLCTDGRKDLFEWVTKQMTKYNDMPDLAQLLKPTSVGLQDKSAEVRKAAEACLLELLRACGFDAINKATRELHGSALAAVHPIIDRQRSPGSASDVSDDKGPTKVMARTARTAPNGAERTSRTSSRAIAAPKPGASKVSKQAAAIAAQDAAVQGHALFNLKDSNKEDRERSIPRKFKFDEPRPEQVQEVETDMTKYFREDLHRRLLSPDFKKQVDGLDMLQKAIPSHIREMMELVDILLRWLVLRFCESNTTCLLKVLEFFPEFVEALKNEGYNLSEFEASIFLPCLVEKSGHNIEKVREKMRELVKLLCCIYPASKLFSFICEGLRSKNNRTRIENVDHIGFMIDRYGVEIAGSTKALQLVASLTTERDGDLRKSALQTLATAYKILGDDVWRYLGKLSDAQKSMIDDKFKWKAREMDKRKEGKPGETRAALRRSVRENGIDAADQSGESTYRPITAPPILSNVRTSNGHFEPPSEITFINTSASPAGPTDWNEALDTIEFGSNSEQVVEGMKVICHELSQVLGDSEGNLADDFIKDADRLVRVLTLKVTTTFNMGLGGASSRSCKYVLNTLMQSFQLKKLAHDVRETSLHSLITELLLWLLDERVPLMDDGSQLLKALNVLMLKILENADRTAAFVVLIRLLRPLDSSRWPTVSSEESAAIRNQKFSDLVVKCLIKLTKVLGSTIFEVDLDRLLQSIHEYLQELGMEEIRRRAGADDKPLRMVKTVLHELVKLRGTAIKGHLSMVPIDSEPQPIILAYIDLNLQTLAAARMLTPAGPTGQSHWVDTSSNGPASPAGHTAEAQLKQELAAVFKKIGDKQTCTIGLYELYRITQLYPQVDIFSQLQNASEAFRTYIRNGLQQMEKSVAAGRAPTSISMVTPPPPSPPTTQHSSSPHSSPKTAATISPPIKSGDDQQQQSSVPPPPGTLDAIRERMRSIQAASAAAAANTTGSPVSAINGSLPAAYSRSFEVPNNIVVSSPSQPTPVPSVVVPTIPTTTTTTTSNVSLAAGTVVDDSALTGLQARMERLKSGGALEPPPATTTSSF